MSREYAMSRVRDALEKSDGNVLKAQRLVMGWLEKDHSLLIGLAGPHLQGIVSHAVNHVAGGGALEAGGKKAPSAPEAQKQTPSKIDPAAMSKSEIGAALMDSLQGKGAAFGESTPRPAAKRGQASQGHIDAIHQIAGKAKPKD